MSDILLSIENLETCFRTPEGTIHAVNGVSMKLEPGETLGIVGESGCGKSVTMLSILGLIPNPPGKVVAGKALYRGQDLLKMKDSEIRHVRCSEIGMVFQDPLTYFNPVLTIGRQVSEPLEVHRSLSHKEALDQTVEMLELVGIPRPKERLNDYPHQFSGGMRQRVMIAMALICSPQILIADEPTTALDVTIQAQIVELVKSLRDRLGMSIIWITHDLSLIAGLAQRMAVMYGGFVIEEAPVEDMYAAPQHPYTLGLLGSLPRLDDVQGRKLVSIEGLPPVLFKKPTSCPFAERCNFRIERCNLENPSLRLVDKCHRVACWVNPETRRENQ
ncbi:MAG: ABC transporter ATP-binding protein [Chloroflexi bacterium]|nr:ABC transporter ATP-binding protein [Chloroflexota bacterium]